MLSRGESVPDCTEQPGTKLRVHVHNEMRDAVVVPDSMYDPQNARARL